MNQNKHSYKVDIIRHAESQFNAHGTKVHDVRLSERGCSQATKLSGSYDLVIVSTLSRARSTFALSQITTKEILYTPLCREIRHGNIIDYLPDEILKSETPADVTQRIEQFKEILREPLMSGKRVCVISHHGFIHVLTGLQICNAQIVTVSIAL